MEHYCSKFNPYHSVHLYAYGNHVLLDTTHHVLFCFLPKVGCTNLKLIFFVSQGLIPRSELNKTRDSVNQARLMSVTRRHNLHHSPVNKSFSDYFKYIMIRHPLEKLASAYRSKIQRYNLTGNFRDTPHYNWARFAIYKEVHPELFYKWQRKGAKEPIHITFSDFITYWLNPTEPDFKYDDHFMSFLQICHPCRTRFDFYGNFRHFNRDAQVLVDKIGASSSDLRQGYYSDDSSSSTDQKMNLYYSTLSEAQKRAVLNKMALELEFYYTIFPEERDSHKQILGIDDDLEL